jgi:hypothetical protein
LSPFGLLLKQDYQSLMGYRETASICTWRSVSSDQSS